MKFLQNSITWHKAAGGEMWPWRIASNLVHLEMISEGAGHSQNVIQVVA
jgi:hypothetical protein